MIVTKMALLCAGILAGAYALLIGAAQLAGATWLHGDELAYVSYHDFNADIFLIDVERGLIHNLTNDRAYDVDPEWSPDGKWLAFVSDRAGRRDIYVMDQFGGGIRRLTDSGGVYSQPRWSADGQRIVFISLNQAPNGIYSVDFNGGNFRRLDDPENPRASITLDLAYEPGYLNRTRSPDGSRIAFMTYRNQAWGIYISPDESRRDAHLLVNIGSFTEVPVWSPDGEKMAYIAHRDGMTDLYVVGVDDGAAPRRLTFNPSVDASPAWHP